MLLSGATVSSRRSFVMTGLVMLAVLVDLVSEISGGAVDPWDYVAKATADVKETNLEVDLGFFGGPFGGNGSITKIGEQNLSVGHLFLAAFQNMATNYGRCAQRLTVAGRWNRVAFSGGLAHKFERLRTATLAALGDPAHRVCLHTEDTLAGLLTLALVASGEVATLDDATARVQRTAIG